MAVTTKENAVTRILPSNTLPIINAGVDERSYFLDLPYIENGQNLYEVLTNGFSEDLIAEKLARLLMKLSRKRLNSIRGSFAVYLNEEVKRPLMHARNEIKKTNSIIDENDIDTLNESDLSI